MEQNGQLDISVLYAEDDSFSREEVLEFLSGRVKEVFPADNGAEGLELFRQHLPDLIVADIHMPVMDGLEMARSIRAYDNDVPIIITTAHSDSSSLIDAIDAGVDHYVAKPVSLGKLLAAIEKNARIIGERKTLKRYHEERERLINELQKVNERLARLATTDSLTGIANRMRFSDALGAEIRRSKRFNNALSLIMFDIDHFKSINDSYGHRAGDSVLCELVRLVSKQVRGHDIFARWGGEEFMIMTTHTNSGGASQFAEKLRHLIESREFAGIARVTCSFGVAELESHDNEDLFTRRVDNALYEAKRRGRNRVETA